MDEALDREKDVPRKSVTKKVQNGSVVIESAERVNQNAIQLTEKARELRGTADATLKQIVAHWKQQTDDLEKELQKYKTKKSASQVR